MRMFSVAAAAAAMAVVLGAWPAAAQPGGEAGAELERAATAEVFSAQARRPRTTRRAAPARRAAPQRRTARPAQNRQRTRITVRRPRSFLDPGTEVLPLSRSYTDYAMPPLYHPSRIWDTTGAFRSPLPGGPPDTGWWP
jgi:hypothetical protein